MKKAFTTIFAIAMAIMPLFAQEVDDVFAFADSEYNVFENGATIVRNVVDHDMSGAEVIYSGVYVMDMGATVDDYLRMHYTISRIDNGTCQICFPITCNSKTETGTYETSPGHLDGDLQDIQCEWFPEGDGTCIVELQIERLSRYGFPPQYEHEADGPTITLVFVKGDAPGPNPIEGDVDGDGEVGISDVNAVIAMILSGNDYDSAYDVNHDGEIGISDVNTIIDIILS